ncbi:hypothetical protein MW887_010528 [Aspergillus wentii]|nr:hypothetical protein MW887_010528 [Aspergillus wentii]
MADEAGKPLLDRGSRTPSPHPPSSTRPSSSSRPDQQARSFELSSESTPLLIRRDNELAYGICEPIPISSPTSRASSPERGPRKQKNRLRLSMILPLIIVLVILAVLVFAFVAPAVVKQYVKEATVFQPTDISIDSATADGLRTRVQGDLVLDAGRVQKRPVRNIGRFATWIARMVETGESEVQIYLPEYGNVLVGIATLPSIKVNVRNGHENHVDFMADLSAGDIHGIRGVALDWLEGRLGRLRIKGRTQLHLKSGLLNLGVQSLSDDVTFEESDFPALPQVKINHVDVHEMGSSTGRGMAVDVSLSASIDSPFTLRIPELGFDVLVPSCSPGEPYITVADAKTQEVQIVPGQLTNMNVSGLVQGLSDRLTRTCPGQKSSPLDFLVKSYTHGLKTTIYVRGANAPSLHTPEWMVDLLNSVTVPLPFTGHVLDGLVKKFTTSNVHFSLPSPLAEPGTPEAQPKVSALMKVLVGMPKQVNIHMDIPHVRANADVYYKGDKFGVLELPKWHPANSTMVNGTDGSPGMLVEFAMKDAPLRVTDSQIFTDVIQNLIFGGKPVELHLVAAVDAEISTGLGRFAVREIPAEGNVSVGSPFGGSIDELLPRVETMDIESTTESSALMNTRINFTNPTRYSATVPLVDFVLVYNATKLARVTARDVSIVPGINSGIHVDLAWSPLESGGPNGVSAGRELLSRYVSDVTLTSQLHLLSMTAEFILYSPFSQTNLEITSVQASAFYEKETKIGSIDYFTPFLIPPGLSPTPHLPVDLVLSGIGYDALVKALGGDLELNVVADIGVRVGKYRELLHYKGNGIAAKVRVLL